MSKLYEYAREVYADFGVDAEAAIGKLSEINLSLPCWQGDDVTGLEDSGEALSGGIMATGSYPGKARNGDELRADLDYAVSLIPGKARINIHAMYLEAGSKVDRDAIEPQHYDRWLDWAKDKGYGLDFNPSLFSHPKAASGYTLSHMDDSIRRFWVEHCKRSRAVADYLGANLKTACINNLWIIDGSKDLSPNRMAYRENLLRSLDEIYEKPYEYMKDAVECKLFGIGSESYVAGSHEFYLAYAVKNQMLLTYDMGHFHPTESVSDKLSATLPFVPGILMHISRGMRWDSDHVAILSDELLALMQELVRSDMLHKVYLSLDFFDASINRIFAWVIGARAVYKALLIALLEPTGLIRKAEAEGNLGLRLALLEECKNLPWGAVWAMFCIRNNVPYDSAWMDAVMHYERDVLLRRT